MSKLQDITKEIKALDKKTIYNYEYEYFKGQLVPDEQWSHLSKTREDYEIFKNAPTKLPDGTVAERGQIDISYGGVVSLRTITNRQDGAVIGYVTETKLSYTPHRDTARKLYDKALIAFREELDVQDIEAFEYWVNNEWQLDYGMSGRDSISDYVGAIEKMTETVKEYNECEEFRHFLDKVIK